MEVNFSLPTVLGHYRSFTTYPIERLFSSGCSSPKCQNSMNLPIFRLADKNRLSKTAYKAFKAAGDRYRCTISSKIIPLQPQGYIRGLRSNPSLTVTNLDLKSTRNSISQLDFWKRGKMNLKQKHALFLKLDRKVGF